MLCQRSALVLGSLKRTRPFINSSNTVECVRLSSSLNPETVGFPSETEGHCDTPFVIFDTGKNAKCRLRTRRPGILSWYSCGPTVYDSAHIGHASSFIRQDVIRRILESFSKDLTVVQVMGITDIDDKIIRKANASGKEWTAVSRYYEQEFVEDLSQLNVMQPHVFTRVSDHIPEILSFVGKLVTSGHAYPTRDGSVYFDTAKYGTRYGKFRQATADDSESPPADEEDEEGMDEKKSPKDFALWKGAKPGEPFWNSPSSWGAGKGRPGWHIECSVMASKIFGPFLDLHTGGKDLIFPHHENEEAQCCAHFGTESWTSHWLHMGHLHFRGDVKMSKSLGNTVSIRSFLDEFSPDLLRLMCILPRYRKNLEYSPDSIGIAQKILKKFRTFLADTTSILNGTKPVSTSPDEANLWTSLETSKVDLRAALLDDFDTSEALKTLLQLITDFNRHYNVEESTNPGSVNFQLVLACQTFVQDFLNVVGFTSFSSQKAKRSHESASSSLKTEGLISAAVDFRNQVRTFSLALDETEKAARKQKVAERKELLQACDTLRNTLATEYNVEVKDHGKTSSWSYSESSSSNQ